MNTKLSLLPLALALPIFAGCGEAVDAADNASKNVAGDIAGAAKGAMDKAAEAINNADISSLSMDSIKEMGGPALKSFTEKLGGLKSVADVESLKSSMGPALDKLVAMKDKLGAALPGTDALKTAVEGLKSKFADNSEMMKALQPILDKVKGLMG